jgi:hypothetical protein
MYGETEIKILTFLALHVRDKEYETEIVLYINTCMVVWLRNGRGNVSLYALYRT